MKFRPCIDLHAGKVKQIIGHTLDNNKPDTIKTNYVSEYPADYYANMFKSDQLAGGHVIMLGDNNEVQLSKALATYPDNFSAGGGMNPQNAGIWLKKGAKKIIVSSYIFEGGIFSENKLTAIVKEIGHHRLVIDLSCKYIDGVFRVMTNKWCNATDLTIDKQTLHALSNYASEFLIHAVDVEGTGQGVDQRLVRVLSDFSGIPITYAGGINSIADIEQIEKIGNGLIDFTVGSGLDIYGGTRLRYCELVNRYASTANT